MIHMKLSDYFGNGIFFPDFSSGIFSILLSFGGEAKLASFGELFFSTNLEKIDILLFVLITLPIIQLQNS